MITYSFNVHTFCNISNSKYPHKHNSIATNRSSNLLLYKAAVSMCLSVCLYPPLFRHDRRIATKHLTHPTQEGPVFFFRVSTNQKSGKCHELPRKSVHFLTPPKDGEREGRTGEERDGEREREAGREGGARAKPGNQLVQLYSYSKKTQITHDTVITVRLYITRRHCHCAQIYAAKMPHRCSDSPMNSVTIACMSRTSVLFL